MSLPVLKKGTMAYLDSFVGLIPVKVLKVTSTPDPLLARPRIEVHYEVTETYGAYKQGDKDVSSPRHVVPRKAIIKRQFYPNIGPYDVEVTP